jgi:hypothetical protein
MPRYKYMLSDGSSLVLDGASQPSDAEVESIAKQRGVSLMPADLSKEIAGTRQRLADISNGAPGAPGDTLLDNAKSLAKWAPMLAGMTGVGLPAVAGATVADLALNRPDSMGGVAKQAGLDLLSAVGGGGAAGGIAQLGHNVADIAANEGLVGLAGAGADALGSIVKPVAKYVGAPVSLAALYHYLTSGKAQ